MTTARRVLTVLALTLGVVVGSSIPASASFGDTAALSSMAVHTALIAAPTQVEAKLLCTTTPRTLKIEWWRSGSRGVTCYLITVHPTSGAPYQILTGPTDETYVTADDALISANPSFTITTLTSYGWTATSAKVGITQC
jgi:hypothetical protein